jgi:hypothetical protein
LDVLVGQRERDRKLIKLIRSKLDESQIPFGVSGYHCATILRAASITTEPDERHVASTISDDMICAENKPVT